MYYIINKEDKQRLDRLKTMNLVKSPNMSILITAGPEFLKEMIKNIQLVQNDLLKGSVKSRDMNALIYTDGASDFADRMKSELQGLVNKITVNPNIHNPITGQKYKKKVV